MRNSFISNRVHCVFATKGRQRWIRGDRRERLHSYLLAAIKHIGAEPIAAGGVEDHVHLLFALSSKLSLAELVQKAKANSSKWMKEEFGIRDFSWQEGYSAFSVGVSATTAVEAYINGQEEHHRRRDLNAELTQMLRQHGVRVEDLPSYGL